jgi:hypothetical protein
LIPNIFINLSAVANDSTIIGFGLKRRGMSSNWGTGQFHLSHVNWNSYPSEGSCAGFNAANAAAKAFDCNVPQRYICEKQ